VGSRAVVEGRRVVAGGSQAVRGRPCREEQRNQVVAGRRATEDRLVAAGDRRVTEGKQAVPSWVVASLAIASLAIAS